MIYVATYDSAEIYSASVWNSGGTLKYFGPDLGARSLGPIIVDSKRQQLIVAELQNGEVYSVNLKSHKSQLIASGLGSPQALLPSPDNQYVYIADSARAKIYRLNLASSNSSPMLFSSNTTLKEPVGLALLSSGRIVVADDRANQLIIFPARGK